MRLLLAEDEEAMAEAIIAYLEYHHYEVDEQRYGRPGDGPYGYL